MSLKLYERLKSILSDIESFLKNTLQDEGLPRSVSTEKDSILKKLKSLQDEYPQLRIESSSWSQDSTSNVSDSSDKKNKQKSLSDSTEIEDDGQEIYSSIGEEEEQVPSKSDLGSCEVLDTGTATFVSAADVTKNSSVTGTLVRKNPGGKVDIKSMMLLVRGKRFCVIKDGMFYMFEKNTSKKQAGSFALRGYEARACTEQVSKKEHTFEVNCPGKKSYLFATSSAEELEKWIKVLNTEAQKIPDLSSSCPADNISRDSIDSGDDENYENPDIDVSTPAVPPLPAVPPDAAAVVEEDDDDDFYADATNTEQRPISDVKPAAAAAEVAVDEDDLIYESCDDLISPESAESSDVNNDVYANMYYGRWNCSADDDNELEFKRGDVITIVSREFESFGWWVGKFNNNVGLVPRDFLTPAYELIS